MIPKITFKTHAQLEAQRAAAAASSASSQQTANSPDTPTILSDPNFFKAANHVLETNNEFTKCRNEYSDLINQTINFYTINAKSVNPIISSDIRTKTIKNLREFKTKLLDPRGNHYKENSYLIYGTGKEILHKIAELFSNEAIPMQSRMDAITEMATKLGVCAGGIVTMLQGTLLSLKGEISGVLGTADEAKNKLLDTTIMEFIKKSKLSYHPGNEVHLVNAFFNYFAPEIGLSERLDNNVRGIERIITPDLLSECRSYALDRIHPVKVGEILSRNYLDQLKSILNADQTDTVNNSDIKDVYDKINTASEALAPKFGNVPVRSYLAQNHDTSAWKFTNQRTLLSKHFIEQLIEKKTIKSEPSEPLEICNIKMQGALIWQVEDHEELEMTGHDLLKLRPDDIISDINKNTAEIDRDEIYKTIFNHLIKSQERDSLDAIDDEWVTQLIKANLCHKTSKIEYHPAIELAASFGCTKALEELLANDKDGIKYKNKNGLTPAMLSSKHGHADAIDLLININRKFYTDQDIIDIYGHAASHGHIELLIKTSHNKIVDFWNHMGLNAASNERIDLLKHITNNNLVNYRWQDSSGYDILMTAARSGNIDVVKTLFGDENSPQGREAPSSQPKLRKQTALSICAERGSVDILNFLLEKNFAPNSRDTSEEGHTVLTMAASRCQASVISALLKDRRTDIKLKDNNGQTALMHAAMRGHLQSLSILLEHKKSGLIINYHCNLQQSALHKSILNKHPQAARMLINKGADFYAACQNNNQSLTGVTLAIAGGDISVIEAMIERSLDIKSAKHPLRVGINNQTVYLTPSQTAAVLVRPNILKYLLGKEKELGDSLELQDHLLLSLSQNHYKFSDNDLVMVIDTLVGAGADLNERSPQKKITPLIAALRAQRSINIVNKLISQGADPHLSDINENTAMHHAATRIKAIENITQLLLVGASPSCGNKRNVTPFMLACQFQDKTVIRKMLEHIDNDQINQKDAESLAALDYALNNTIAVNKLYNSYLLIKRGALINDSGNENDQLQKIIDLALGHNDTKYIDAVIDNYAKNGIDSSRFFSRSLFAATKLNKPKFINHLSNKGDIIDCLDENMESPLFLAVRNDLRQAAAALIDMGANKDIKNIELKNPVDIAMEKRNLHMLHLLNSSKKRKTPDA